MVRETRIQGWQGIAIPMARAGQGRAGQGRAGQGRAGQGRDNKAMNQCGVLKQQPGAGRQC